MGRSRKLPPSVGSAWRCQLARGVQTRVVVAVHAVLDIIDVDYVVMETGREGSIRYEQWSRWARSAINVDDIETQGEHAVALMNLKTAIGDAIRLCERSSETPHAIGEFLKDALVASRRRK